MCVNTGKSLGRSLVIRKPESSIKYTVNWYILPNVWKHGRVKVTRTEAGVKTANAAPRRFTAFADEQMTWLVICRCQFLLTRLDPGRGPINWVSLGAARSQTRQDNIIWTVSPCQSGPCDSSCPVLGCCVAKRRYPFCGGEIQFLFAFRNVSNYWHCKNRFKLMNE